MKEKSISFRSKKNMKRTRNLLGLARTKNKMTAKMTEEISRKLEEMVDALQEE